MPHTKLLIQKLSERLEKLKQSSFHEKTYEIPAYVFNTTLITPSIERNTGKLDFTNFRPSVPLKPH